MEIISRTQLHSSMIHKRLNISEPYSLVPFHGHMSIILYESIDFPVRKLVGICATVPLPRSCTLTFPRFLGFWVICPSWSPIFNGFFTYKCRHSIVADGVHGNLNSCYTIIIVTCILNSIDLSRSWSSFLKWLDCRARVLIR